MILLKMDIYDRIKNELKSSNFKGDSFSQEADRRFSNSLKSKGWEKNEIDNFILSELYTQRLLVIYTDVIIEFIINKYIILTLTIPLNIHAKELMIEITKNKLLYFFEKK